MADKKFTLQFDFEGNITPIKTAVENFKKTLKEVKLPDNLSTSIEKTLSKLNSEMESFEALTKMDFNNLGDISKAEKSFGKIITLLNQLEIQSKSITGLDAKKFLPQTTIDRVKKLEKAWEDLEKETNKKDELSKKIQAQTEAIEEQRAALKKLEDEREALANINKAKGARKGQLVSSQNADKKRREEVVTEMTALESEKGGKSSARYTALKQELSSLGQAINNADREIDALSKDIAKNQVKINSYKSNIEGATNSLQQMEKELIDLQNSNITPKGLNELRQELAQLKNVQIDQIPVDLKELQQAINSLTDDELKEISVSLEEIKKSANNLPESAHKGAEGIQDLVESGRNAAQAADEIQNLKNQVLQFFSITNAIQLFKRTVQSALETVKELDAVMTETAVVTDFTIGDMWEKLPEYSAEATKLGASIRDLYGATTLYYQQGLQTEEAMSVGIETMKMARIAGMEAADATEAMTAALRGFNMEVNETNAVRVNDVYSELAAITAADTEQIATAMSKTASIAASANMEFETTAALLAQIIETTQEAPETAGTAMKTIIARFTEVKELFNEGMLTGEDSEGEEININKIDAALKTVGISLKDFLNGQKGIDDIFLELASKWDGLDLATQRYIATMAAGSRQQSRFIAMMSNYDRTMELVTAANNSAGASQEQFDKTLESMEAKLQKLKNAWDEFTMGLANNEILKFGVDLLTGFLETVNKLTEALSGGNGLVKSVISLVTVIGALKGGSALLSGLFGKENEQGTGLFSKFFNKKKEGGSSKSSENQNRKQGEKDGKAYMSGWNRAVEQGKEKGFKAGLKGFFTQEISKKTEGIDQEKLLGSIEKKFLETDINSTLSDELATLHQSLDQGGISAEKAGEKFKELGGDLQGTEPVIKSTSVDLQSVGQATMAVGGAVGLLSVLFENMGWEEGAEGASAVSAALVTLGGVLSGLPSIISFVGSVATATGISVQAAWIWVVGIVAVIGLIVGAVVAMNNAAKEKSLAGQMEKTQQATEAATQAAEQAQEAYDNLLSNKNKYTALQDSLRDLTKGTNEWKQALLESNEIILNLLSTYPELASHIKLGDNGQLTVDNTGWDMVLDSSLQAIQRTTSEKISAQMAEIELQNKQTELNLKKAFKNKNTFTYGMQGAIGFTRAGDGFTGNFYTGTSYEDSIIFEADTLEAMMHAYETRPVELFENDEILEMIRNGTYDGMKQASNFTIDELRQLRSSIVNYEQALLENEIQLEAQAKALAQSIASNEITSHQDSDAILSFFGDKLSSNQYQQEIDERAQSLTTNAIYGSGNETFDALVEKFNLVSSMSSNYTDNLKELYAAMTQQKVEDLEDMNVNEIAKAIASMSKNDELSKIMDDFTKKYESATKEGKEGFQGIATNGKSLTYDELENLDDFETRANYYDTVAKALEMSSNELAELQGYTGKTITDMTREELLAYGAKLGIKPEENATREELIDLIVETGANTDLSASQIAALDFNLQIENETFQRNRLLGGIAEKTGVNEEYNKNILKNYSSTTLSSLSTQIDTMSEEGAAKYVKKWNEIIKNSDLTEEQQKQLETYLSQVDWSNSNEAINALEYMQDLNLDSTIIKQFWDVATDAAGMYIKTVEQALSFSERFREKTKEVSEIQRALEEGSATDEQIQTLFNAGIDISKFELTEEGWKATEEQITEATKALQGWNAENARMNIEKTREKFEKHEELIQSNDTVRGLVVKENGQLKAEKIVDSTQAASINETMGLNFLRDDFNTDEEYISAVQSGFNEIINSLNIKELIIATTEKTAEMLEVSSFKDKISTGETAEITKEIASGQEQSFDIALQQSVEQTEGAAGSLALFNQQLEEEGKVSEKNSKTIQLLAVRHANASKVVQDLKDKLNDNIDVLKKGSSQGQKYTKALEEIATVAKNVFGDQATADFVANNKDLFIQLQKGGEKGQDAFEKIRDKILEAEAEERNWTDEVLKEFKNVINQIEEQNPNLEIGATFDATQVVNELLKMGRTAEEVQKIMQNAGYSVEFDYETLYIGNITGRSYRGPEPPRATERGESVTKTQVVVSATATKTKDGSSFTPSNTGSGSSKTKWENPYDEFYNTVEDINEELRTREKLERRYQALLAKTGTKASDLVKNAQDQIKSLEKEKKLHEGLLQGRNRQMSDIESEYSNLSKYAWYNEQDGTIEIDWEKIEALDGSTNEKLTSRIEEYIGKLEEQQNLIEEEEDSLDEIEETIREIRDQGKDEYFDLESQIKEALISARQDEIDKLNAINDSINDTNSRLIDAMQSSIDKYRQNRENERTEEELSDKQRRLAYLQQDTSGANALEIMQLQEELDQAQEDYTDTLIDQKISELQQQNDEAAEQRQQQIDIMNEQLQHWIDTGKIWDEVYRLMDIGMDTDGIKAGSELEALLQEGASFEAMSNLEKMKWLEELENDVAMAIQWLMVGNSTKGLLSSGDIKKGDSVTFTTQDGKTVTGTVQEDGSLKTETGEVYSNVYRSYDGKTFYTTESYQSPKIEEEQENSTQTSQPPELTKNDKRGVSAAIWNGNYGWGVGKTRANRLKEVFGENDIQKNYVEKGVTGGYTGKLSEYSYANMKKKFKQFKTGGLADFTGPAWLDGTKSKPEYILNSDQTKAFFELVDVLSGLKSGVTTSSQINGDSIYDVDINVESIGSDYDVEQLAQTVKRMINDDARYRNNNAINLSR